MQSLASLANTPNDFFVSLTHYNGVYAYGEQALDFLHGQLTIHTKKLEVDSARRCAHCDAKGKAWSMLTVLKQDDGLLMLANKEALTASLKQFKKYAVFSKVTFQDLSNERQHFFVVGKAIEEWLQHHFSHIPAAPMDAVNHELGVVINQTNVHQHAYHLMLNEQGQLLLREFIQQRLLPEFGIELFEALNIQAGIPDISGDNINQFVPQMFNLQLLDGIDFDKGCYMGQEVIARTRYLGKNKRAAMVFQWPGATTMQIGATVEKQLGEHWRSAGTVIRCATLGHETWMMAIVANDTQTDEQHRLANLDSSPIFTAKALVGAPL